MCKDKSKHNHVTNQVEYNIPHKLFRIAHNKVR